MIQIDITFVKKLQIKKNPKDFSMLFQFYGPKIKALMIRSGSDYAFAEDIMHDTMLTVWKKIDLYNSSKGSFSSWIYTIARNNRIDILRKKSSQPYVDINEVEMMSNDPDSEKIILDSQTAANIKKMVRQLPQKQKIIIEMAFNEDLTQKEIAEKLEIPIGTVKSRMRLAYIKLKEGFKEYQ
ncbi:sigma-70 family RNA polymerase sigma factor [Hyphomicrobiales bacterium]|jgi:RNA polymerase sigma-70 factor (ECF subfamily)|nr:sigma-70 family RNA polymerase sigma factor [Rhodobiaceae bacterium]MDB4128352.1 sigma-70 family RNA polymerase sigma factor [Hyphomicrobiales bacterium]MBT5640254.1 sigma-70 family RNA polymerase sigma factor [Rhodobiaceae bacterium]MBT6223206.1 sigma-70 family RNA polymerase sigma factor [Rhodobiaceae bacterium]MDB4831050.1 sigma-70 family RNA polymerase sigma factor [Hyphomicrobiales bacterium]|tara:strand:+ start:2889 stop:3434 length:546 start_codon:yes stop_codon:yes gene_type:complete